MSWVALVMAIVLAMPTFAMGQVPKLECPDRVNEHTLVRAHVKGIDPKTGLDWEVLPPEKVDRATTAPDVLEFTAPPGEYVVRLAVFTFSQETGFKITRLSRKVTIGRAEPPLAPPGPPITPPVPPKVKPDPVAATGRITFGNSGCTATVIYPRRADGRWDVLTAAHCVTTANRGRLNLRTGQSVSVRVVKTNSDADICWLVTEEPAEGLPFAELAPEIPDAGTAVWHNGYGVDRPENREDGVVDGQSSGGQLRMTLNVSSGDSGGGIFRSDTGQLVAVVCCTQSRGQKTTMYGGSSVMAARLRPTSSEVDAQPTQEIFAPPAPMPDPRSGWAPPAPMPEPKQEIDGNWGHPAPMPSAVEKKVYIVAEEKCLKLDDDVETRAGRVPLGGLLLSILVTAGLLPPGVSKLIAVIKAIRAARQAAAPAPPQRMDQPIVMDKSAFEALLAASHPPGVKPVNESQR